MSPPPPAPPEAISRKGTFALAIPGGSILNMLPSAAPSWAKDTVVAYVNHKAVGGADVGLSTHEKARGKFLQR